MWEDIYIYLYIVIMLFYNLFSLFRVNSVSNIRMCLFMLFLSVCVVV